MRKGTKNPPTSVGGSTRGLPGRDGFPRSRACWEWRDKVVLERKDWPVDPDLHLGLMYTELRRYCVGKRLGLYDELLGEAYEALCNAARTFTPEKGYRFSTHAVRALRWQLGFRHKRMDGLKRKGDSASLCNPAPWAGRSVDPEWVRDERGMGEERRAELAAVRETLDLAMAGMDEREKHVLDGFARGMPLHAIGAEIGATREWVRQIRMRAIDAARKRLGIEVEEAA